MNNEIDSSVVNLAKAIRQKESGGNFGARGQSGEYGAYQFTPNTWKSTASKYGITTSLEQATPEQQNAVAYNQIKEWKDKGHDVTEIASMWNAGQGEPKAYTGKFGTTTSTHKAGDPSKGVNQYGARYDVPGYVTEVAQNYVNFKNENQPPQLTTRKKFSEEVKNVEQSIPTDLTASTGQGLLGKTIGVLGTLSGTKKLGEGAGYALANMTGNQQQLIDAQDKALETQNKLVGLIKQKKARGEDTTRLQTALDQVNSELGQAGEQVKMAGTGGITNKQVLGSAAQTALTVATAPKAISGLVNILKGPLAKTSIQTILKGSLGKGETLANLSRQEAQMTLNNYLKEMPVTEVGGKTAKEIVKALQALDPSYAKPAGFVRNLVRLGVDSIVIGTLVKNIFGEKAAAAVSTIKGMIP